VQGGAEVIYVEAPNTYDGEGRSVFLAGGITGCPDWQADVVKMLTDTDLVLFNPRRVDFPIHDPGASQKQIQWEHDHLRKADAILFWFPCETMCPIVLYELGAWSMMGKPLFVGVHSDYSRRRDVEIQTSLARPDVSIFYGLEDLAWAAKTWIRKEVDP
jgi:hypothetical protein